MTDITITIAQALQVVSEKELARIVAIMADIKISRRGMLLVQPSGHDRQGLFIQAYNPAASETKGER